MAEKVKALIDLNIILDTLQKREPFFEQSARILAAAETGIIEGWIAAQTITTLFYLISKDRSNEQARIIITDLLQFLSVATVDQITIEQALNLPWKDFEDAVQMISAIRCGADTLVTRDREGYPGASISIVTPAELLSLI